MVILVGLVFVMSEVPLEILAARSSDIEGVGLRVLSEGRRLKDVAFKCGARPGPSRFSVEPEPRTSNLKAYTIKPHPNCNRQSFFMGHTDLVNVLEPHPEVLEPHPMSSSSFSLFLPIKT